MKKIGILFICCVLGFAEFDGSVVDNQTDETRNGKVWGEIPSDGLETFNEPLLAPYQRTGGCNDSPGECSMYIMQGVEQWAQDTIESLEKIDTQWLETNKKLNGIIDITKELAIAQRNALAQEEAKLLKLQEINHNLEKALKLDVPRIEILQENQGLNDESLSGKN